MRRIAISLSKGGVGKTTTAVNIAAGLASEFNHQCLVELSHLTGWVYRRIPYHD